MANAKGRIDQASNSIDENDNGALRKMAEECGATPDQVRAAISAKGANENAVCEFLNCSRSKE